MSVPKPVSRSQAATLQGRPDAALALPDSSETWFRSDIEIGHGALSTFSRTEIIEAVGSDNSRTEWQTAQGVAEWVEDHLAGRTYTPCGCSTGIRTVEAGETYTCRDDECACRFGRETAEEVVA
jgi:hypothetical protein